ncbi:hypothetical protein PVAP13_1NG136338 [Panicum virgatum]|uniref:Uncharacterized protein n=1 Tax=Panicum virgatum TaxID=38727 RepID=A0A8T0WLJ3_PANVG|nr:hypothetical protein PVAP13_1NG136338 [Panicum virgatum]
MRPLQRLTVLNHAYYAASAVEQSLVLCMLGRAPCMPAAAGPEAGSRWPAADTRAEPAPTPRQPEGEGGADPRNARRGARASTHAAQGRAASPPPPPQTGAARSGPSHPRSGESEAGSCEGEPGASPGGRRRTPSSKSRFGGRGKKAREEESVGAWPPALHRVAQQPHRDAPVPAPRLAPSRAVQPRLRCFPVSAASGRAASPASTTPGRFAPLAGEATRAAAVTSSDPPPAPAGLAPLSPHPPCRDALPRATAIASSDPPPAPAGERGGGGRVRGKRARKKDQVKREKKVTGNRTAAGCVMSRARGGGAGGGGGVEALKPANPYRHRWMALKPPGLRSEPSIFIDADFWG